jgi:peptidoglycan/LPS O-acetylase OafA/YrhL
MGARGPAFSGFYIPTLNGLRAIAFFIVFIPHAQPFKGLPGRLWSDRLLFSQRIFDYESAAGRGAKDIGNLAERNFTCKDYCASFRLATQP